MKLPVAIRLTLVLSIVCVFFLSIYYIIPVQSSEPSLTDILTYLGFTNVAETTVETFSRGTYNITLYAEFAGYSDENELSYYEVNTTVYTLIFTGLEGGSGYLSPPVTKTFTADYQFGLSMLSPEHRYFTETSRNPDEEQHTKVYRNLDDPDMFLIGFENQYGGGDRDYNDMVFSLKCSQAYLTVETDPPSIVTIPGEGWYNNCTYVNLTAPTPISVSPGVQYRFDYWDVDGANVSGNPITVHMNANHTATAHFMIQYYLTVISQYGTPGGEGWYDNCTYTYATLDTGTVDHGNETRRVFTHWSGDTSGTNYAQSDSIHMDGPKTVTANWKTQYKITFSHTGLDSTASSTVVTVNGAPKSFSDLPFELWADDGSSVTYNYDTIISSTVAGKRFMLDSISSPPSPFTVTGPVTITGNYKTQHELTVHTNGLGIEVTNVYNGTTVLGTATDAASYSNWFDEDSLLQLNIDSPITVGPTKLIFTQWSGDATGTNRPVLITMDSAKDVTANYKTQYEIIFDQSGVYGDYAGTVITVDGTDYSVSGLPVSFWWDEDSTHNFTFQSPLIVTVDAERYVWISTSGLSTQQSGSITVSTSGSITGNYETQYFLTVTSLYDSPTPTSGWSDDGTVITASVTSPWAGPTGVRYVCTGWSGTGSVPASGAAISVVFTISEPSSITWNWKTQYYLTVQTDPSGLSPAPTPSSGWYDEDADVTLNAPDTSYLGSEEYSFDYWDVDGTPKGTGVNPISVIMDQPYTATAHYFVATVTPPLSVAISPLSATILIGDSVAFTSTVTGGTSPYTYQWYLDGDPVSGANSSSWLFKPNATGIYYVHLEVTDDNNDTAQSEIAKVTVSTISTGGYSVSLAKTASKTPLICYTVLLAIFGVVITLIKRKRE